MRPQRLCTYLESENYGLPLNNCTQKECVCLERIATLQKCYLCKKQVQYYIVKSKRLEQIDVELLEYTGRNAYMDQCRQCKEFKLMGDNKLCEECATQYVDPYEYICVSCNEIQKRVLEKNYAYQQTKDKFDAQFCMSCGAYSDSLNANNICSECKAVHDDYDAPKIKPVKRYTCITMDCMEKAEINSLFCKKCQVPCKSCGTKFSRIKRTDKYCKKCEEIAISGRCTTCLTPDRKLNAQLHCSVCEKLIRHEIGAESEKAYTNAFTEKCPLCGLNAQQVTVTEDGITVSPCEECKDGYTFCVICHNNEIGIDEFVCSDCLIQRTNG